MHRLCGWWKRGINGKESETKVSSDCYFGTFGFPVEFQVGGDCKTKKIKLKSKGPKGVSLQNR
jgi:hypothetical protein